MIGKAARFTVLVVFCLSTRVFAEPAEDLVSTFLGVMATEDLESTASFYDPADLRSFRESLKFVEEDDRATAALYEPFFGGDATIGTVRNLNDAQFFAPFLKLWFDEEELFEIDFANHKILGSVREDTGLVHVISRHPVLIGDETVETILVTQVDDSGNRPLIKIPPEVAMLPAVFSQFFDETK